MRKAKYHCLHKVSSYNTTCNSLLCVLLALPLFSFVLLSFTIIWFFNSKAREIISLAFTAVFSITMLSLHVCRSFWSEIISHPQQACTVWIPVFSTVLCDLCVNLETLGVYLLSLSGAPGGDANYVDDFLNPITYVVSTVIASCAHVPNCIFPVYTNIYACILYNVNMNVGTSILYMHIR